MDLDEFICSQLEEAFPKPECTCDEPGPGDDCLWRDDEAASDDVYERAEFWKCDVDAFRAEVGAVVRRHTGRAPK